MYLFISYKLLIRFDRIFRNPRNPLLVYLFDFSKFTVSKVNLIEPKWTQVNKIETNINNPSKPEWSQVIPSESEWTWVNQSVNQN